MYENRVNGKAVAGESVVGNMDFYTVVVTGMDLTITASAPKLNKLVEIISLNGQPVILGAPTVSGGDSTLKFVVEHGGSWASAADLKAAIIAHQVNGMGFASNNVTVTVSATV